MHQQLNILISGTCSDSSPTKIGKLDVWVIARHPSCVNMFTCVQSHIEFVRMLPSTNEQSPTHESRSHAWSKRRKRKLLQLHCMCVALMRSQVRRNKRNAEGRFFFTAWTKIMFAVLAIIHCTLSIYLSRTSKSAGNFLKRLQETCGKWHLENIVLLCTTRPLSLALC